MFFGYTFAELCVLFFVYGFAGWILETIYATIRHHAFSNRGALNGPFCATYGIGGVIITLTVHELTGFWLFLFSMIYATIVEWIGGHMIEHFWHRRLWNYENRRWNLDGYICVPASLLWGALGYCIVRWGNHLVLNVTGMLPHILCLVILWVLTGIFAADVLGTHFFMQQRGKHMEQWKQSNKRIANITAMLESRIVASVEKRMQKAYPQAEKKVREKEKPQIFAEGCSFYKLVWIFFFGSLIGDITETIFCRITAGVWMSRSSLVWGPFSIVWGAAMVFATALLYKSIEKGSFFIFLTGTFLGGAYEYLCSVLTEMFFGKVFWDYSKLPFNLGGRINLLYCFFWGIAAVVWIRVIYPNFSRLIEKIPLTPGKILSWLIILFMMANMLVSFLALVRYEERSHAIPAANVVEEWLDTDYNDAVMKRIYPNAISTDPQTK